jgi:hypothetical protein
MGEIALTEHCVAQICFVPLDMAGQKLFGFAEFLAGLALMVLAWTTADIRYRFRIAIAPLPLKATTFFVVATVGVLTLLTDLWRAQGWLVPVGDFITPAIWQAILGGLFLVNFLTWAWFAFVSPPVFGRLNYQRFATTLYHFILRGSQSELAVIADELTYSFKQIVKQAPVHDQYRKMLQGDIAEKEQKPSKYQGTANDLLLLIADRRFCRAIVQQSPLTILALFQQISETKKYGIQVRAFAKNIVHEALIERDSFLYHETEGYETGLIGFHRPLTQAMFSNYPMVETIGSMFDQAILWQRKCDASQWEAYCRIVLITIESYLKDSQRNHSTVLYRATGYIENAASDLYKLDGIASSGESDSLARLETAVDFIKQAVTLLDKYEKPNIHVQWRIREEHGHPRATLHDHLASMLFELIFSASAVKSPKWECWSIQHNSIWSEFFNFSRQDTKAARIVKFKLRRLLYDEIVDMRRFANFKGARILSFCLNVLGLSNGPRTSYSADSRPLAIAVLSWTKRNFAWLYEYNPEVGKMCLVEGITYDRENFRLVRTYPAENLRREPHYVYLALDKPTDGDAASIPTQ